LKISANAYTHWTTLQIAILFSPKNQLNLRRFHKVSLPARLWILAIASTNCNALHEKNIVDNREKG